MRGSPAPSSRPRVPAILGEDRGGRRLRDGLAAARHATRSGRRSCATARSIGGVAAAVGDVLGRIHAATADRPDIAARFADRRHLPRDPARALPRGDRARASRPRARSCSRWSRRPRAHQARAGPRRLQPEEHPDRRATGPVILDAECAWYGDPAFDLAFVLNHLLLKGVWRPAVARRLRRRRSTRWSAPIARTSTGSRRPRWSARTAALLPALLLARIDGKSPVEYLTDDDRRRTTCAAFARAAASRRRPRCRAR